MRAQLALAFALVGGASAHIALWDPAMYGWDDSNPNQQDPINPLMNLPFSEWWFHGYIDQPPDDGVYMDLPSGGTYHGQVACNKAYTTWGPNSSLEDVQYACDSIGPLHTADSYGAATPTDVKGCAIAIAYQSDVTQIQPEDFAVISVNYTCPWYKDVDFQIPSDLPPCPEGGCHCMWGWIHSADSGSEQNYFLGYRCNVTGATGVEAIPAPAVANKCDYPTDTSNCTVGAKQPWYWFQAEANNNFQGTYDPPFYNGAYGFMNGAQTDLFAGNGTSASTNTSSTSAAGSSSSSSSATEAGSSASASTSATSTTESVASSTSTADAGATSPAASSSSSSIHYTSTTQTTIYVTTTIDTSSSSSAPVSASSTGINVVAAIVTGAATSTSSLSSAASAAATTSSKSQCKRKRSLSGSHKLERRLRKEKRHKARLAGN